MSVQQKSESSHLHNKLSTAALVTGGATRLGLEFAKALAHAGYDIALHYHHSVEAAEAAVEEITTIGVACHSFQSDLSGKNPEQLIDTVVATFPHCRVLVNSASAYEAGSIAETDMTLLQHQFAVNFFAPFALTQAFAKHIVVFSGECDTTPKGTVINILDNKIAFQQSSYAAYLLSKKSLAEFTQLAAMEYAPSLRINGIAPGVVMPGDQRTDDYIDWRVQGIPIKRQGEAKHLIKALYYLLDNDFVTGQILTVDGGESGNFVGLNAEQYLKNQRNS